MKHTALLVAAGLVLAAAPRSTQAYRPPSPTGDPSARTCDEEGTLAPRGVMLAKRRSKRWKRPRKFRNANAHRKWLVRRKKARRARSRLRRSRPRYRKSRPRYRRSRPRYKRSRSRYKRRSRSRHKRRSRSRHYKRRSPYRNSRARRAHYRRRSRARRARKRRAKRRRRAHRRRR